jgi:hypothetical protein
VRQAGVRPYVVEDDARVEAARASLKAARAESIDAARQRWWLGLRSAEQEQYTDGPHAFERHEDLYRRGFEAALAFDARGRTWEELHGALRARHGLEADAPAFRRGWERGHAYQHRLADPGLKKTA